MENIELWQQYEKTKSQEIKDLLITKYVNLIKIVAGRMNIYTNSIIEYDDLIGYGVFGLIDAIDKFDYKKGYKFETYASLRIRGEIIDNIRKIDWIPRTIRQRNKELEKAVSQFEIENGREPSEEEIAKALDVSIEQVGVYMKNSSLHNVISLDGYLEQSHEKVNNNLVDNRKLIPSNALDKKEEKEMLIKAIESLTEKQKMVITLYYYEELTLKEISQIMGVSESRISQIHSKCMKMLKAKLGENFISLCV